MQYGVFVFGMCTDLITAAILNITIFLCIFDWFDVFKQQGKIFVQGCTRRGSCTNVQQNFVRT